jgi:hypothetical protein
VVKRAYLECAMRYHPDRLVGRSPDEVETAEFRMREINAAWEVLRSPADRARYDDELRAPPGGAPVGRPGGRVPPPSTPGFGAEPEAVADLTPASAPEPQLSACWKFGPVIVGGVVLVVLLVVISSAVNRQDRPATVRTVEEHPVGSCVLITTDDALGTEEPGAQVAPLVIDVPCDGPRSGKVVERAVFPLSCPQGTTAYLLPDHENILCLVR